MANAISTASAHATAEASRKVLSEKEVRREYKLSIGAQATIVFAGALVIFLNLVKYGYENQLWWWIPDIANYSREQIFRGVEIALIGIDGAAKAAILSFAVTFILRIDIKKFVSQVVEAQPLLSDPTEGARLRELLRGEVANLTRQVAEKEKENEKLRAELIQGGRRFEGFFETLIDQIRNLRTEFNNQGKA